MIPENVLEVLESIADAVANSTMLFSDERVTCELVGAIDEEAARWLHDNPKLYIKAVSLAIGQGGENE